MFYDAQIAGLPDTSPAVRLVKARSAASSWPSAAAPSSTAVRERRRAASSSTAAARAAARDRRRPGASPSWPPGPGSTARPCSTATTTSPRGPRRPSPSPVVRRPAPGYRHACSAAATSRRDRRGGRGCPRRSAARACGWSRAEGAGEVQTPARRATAPDGLRVGDRVWFRHAKAGELCERFDALHLVSGDRARRDGADLPRRGKELRVTDRDHVDQLGRQPDLPTRRGRRAPTTSTSSRATLRAQPRPRHAGQGGGLGALVHPARGHRRCAAAPRPTARRDHGGRPATRAGCTVRRRHPAARAQPGPAGARARAAQPR